jgi:signal transduction histidine kinase
MLTTLVPVPYRSIEDPIKLRRVLEATLLLESDLELPSLLRHVVEEARSMTGARYAALGVLNATRTALDEFITVGLRPEEEERIGDRPTGRGVLGLMIIDPRPLHLERLGTHPDSSGFPPGHPPMSSFLGVPIKVRDEVYGNLYLTDKTGASSFTTDDEALVEALALAAGMAVENYRLHQRVHETAVFEDRARMARDLHDTVIQRLYAIGLSLQSMSAGAATEGLADRLGSLVTDIDETIRQVRSSIYELGPTGGGTGVRAQVLTLVRSLNPVVGFEVRVIFDGAVDAAIPEAVQGDLLATVREALTNVGRHSQASRATLTLRAGRGVCRLEVSDNGRGLDPSTETEGGLGLVNLQRRAEGLGGTMLVGTGPDGGTSLVWQVPIA